MKFAKLASPAGFAVWLAVGLALFLLVVGFRTDTLPYPPAQGSYDSSADMPAGWPFSDAVISHWPDALFLQQSMRTGTWPLWRPLIMSGQPFATNPLNKVWYPPQWLVVLLPPALHLNLLIWAHLILAGIGMRALGVRLLMPPPIANVLGIAYALTPRLLAATGAGHLDIVYAIAWFPWVLWAVHQGVSQDGSFRRRAAILGLVIALCFLADIRLSLFIFATSAVFTAYSWVSADRQTRLPARSAASALLLGAVLAAGLTAVQWIPLVTLLPYLSRSGLSVAEAGVYSLQPLQAITLVFADRGGSHETMVYVGIPVLVLALFGLWRSPQARFWAGAAFVSALYALGLNSAFWTVLVKLIPPLLWFRVPSRAWIVVVLSLIIMAGYGLMALNLGIRQNRVQRLWGTGLLALGLTLIPMATILPLRQGAGVAALLGFLATGLLFLTAPRLSNVAVAAAVIVVLDLIWVDASLVHGLPPRDWLDVHAPLAQALLDAGATKVYSPDYSLPQQAAAYWNIPTFGGIDPFQFSSYIPAFESATGTQITEYSVTLPPFTTDDLQTANRATVIDAAQLAQWNVSHVVASYPLDMKGLRLVQQIGKRYLYENILWNRDTAIIWETPNRFTARNHSNKSLIVSVWIPGWQRVDPVDQQTDKKPGQDVIVIAPGRSETWQYGPPELGLSLALSAGSLLMAGSMLVIVRDH